MKSNHIFLLGFMMFTMTDIKAQNNPDFVLINNGQTCSCPNANFGETGTLTINGVQKTFTKRTKSELETLILNDDTDPQIELTCTSGITDMSSLFSNADNFNQNINHWDVSHVTSMEYMFSTATNFNQPINHWDVSDVDTMRFMFEGTDDFNQNLNSWNVNNVINMNGMFFQADSFNQPLNNWNVSNVMFMVGMFEGTDNFNQPTNNWNVSNVILMVGMFYDAVNFDQPLDNWDVSSVINMNTMFSGASNFNQDLSSWCVEQIPQEPIDFATNSALQTSFMPNWGAECETFSVSENERLNLKIYPVPASDKVFIDNMSNITFNEIKIIDMFGRTLIEKDFAKKEAFIDVSFLNAGSYFIQFYEKDDVVLTKRFIKK